MNDINKSINKLLRATTNACTSTSKLSKDVLNIEGMSSSKIRHFLNNIIDDSANKVKYRLCCEMKSFMLIDMHLEVLNLRDLLATCRIVYSIIKSAQHWLGSERMCNRGRWGIGSTDAEPKRPRLWWIGEVSRQRRWKGHEFG